MSVFIGWKTLDRCLQPGRLQSLGQPLRRRPVAGAGLDAMMAGDFSHIALSRLAGKSLLDGFDQGLDVHFCLRVGMKTW